MGVGFLQGPSNSPEPRGLLVTCKGLGIEYFSFFEKRIPCQVPLQATGMTCSLTYNLGRRVNAPQTTRSLQLISRMVEEPGADVRRFVPDLHKTESSKIWSEAQLGTSFVLAFHLRFTETKGVARMRRCYRVILQM